MNGSRPTHRRAPGDQIVLSRRQIVASALGVALPVSSFAETEANSGEAWPDTALQTLVGSARLVTLRLDDSGDDLQMTDAGVVFVPASNGTGYVPEIRRLTVRIRQEAVDKLVGQAVAEASILAVKVRAKVTSVQLKPGGADLHLDIQALGQSISITVPLSVTTKEQQVILHVEDVSTPRPSWLTGPVADLAIETVLPQLAKRPGFREVDNRSLEIRIEELLTQGSGGILRWDDKSSWTVTVEPPEVVMVYGPDAGGAQ